VAGISSPLAHGMGAALSLPGRAQIGSTGGQSLTALFDSRLANAAPARDGAVAGKRQDPEEAVMTRAMPKGAGARRDCWTGVAVALARRRDIGTRG
jgi:hypothetical protein